MQITAKRGTKPKFKLTKREQDQMQSACSLTELIAKNADGEPIGDAALKAVEGLQSVLGVLAGEVEA